MTPKEKTILSEEQTFTYFEKAPTIDPGEFQKVIDSRRSVRVFDDTKIPEDIVRTCIENGLLAPNSSNLQPWEIYWVSSPEKKRELARYCLSQIAAKKAAELIVLVARTATWRQHAREMVTLFTSGPDKAPAMAIAYYKKIVPFVYTQGFLGILGFLKRIAFFVKGLSSPVIREPVTRAHLRTWAIKTTALAAENIMLSFRAYGYDTCPMEGYDSKRIKKLLGLPRDSAVVMVIAAGKRTEGGIYGPRIRYDSARFIKKV
ncbi:MAG TPA: nitroreductase family protein [Spirochaetota bacterium]|nr:nitroreductase family protein [Spirochaetota bacterium]